MADLNFDNRIHVKNGLYCLNDIADKLIESTNIKEYMKKIQNKEWIDGKYYITKDHMMHILIKSKAYAAKDIIYKNNILNKIEYNHNFNDFIHIENNLFCLNDIAEKLLYKQNIISYIGKINNKKLIHGNYYISKEDMIKQLMISKSIIGHQYLKFINDKNNYIIKAED